MNTTNAFTNYTCDLSLAITSNLAFNTLQWLEILAGILSACLNSALIVTLCSTKTIEPFVRMCLIQISACFVVSDLLPIYSNGEVQLIGGILGKPCQLENSLINCLLPAFAISNGLLTSVSCTMVALTVHLAYKCNRLKRNIIETSSKAARLWPLPFIAMMCGVFVGSYTFGNVIVFTNGWNARIPICVRQFINGSPSQRILVIFPVVFETFTLVLWPYTRRTNNEIYERFRVNGYHQTLQLRLVLRRNITAVRALFPTISFHAFTTVVTLVTFIVAAQIMEKHTAVDGFDGIIDRELLGLILRTSKRIYGFIHPIILIRHYDVILRPKLIHNQMNFPEFTQLPGTNVFVPTFVVADAGYGAIENTQTPVEVTNEKQHLTPAERAFNLRHALCRTQVERTLGSLRGHFRVHDRTLQFNVGHSRRFIQVTCLLHMFIMAKEGTDYHAEFAGNMNNPYIGKTREQLDKMGINGTATRLPRQQPQAHRREDGLLVREALKNWVNTYPGKLAWQDDHIFKKARYIEKEKRKIP